MGGWSQCTQNTSTKTVLPTARNYYCTARADTTPIRERKLILTVVSSFLMLFNSSVGPFCPRICGCGRVDDSAGSGDDGGERRTDGSESTYVPVLFWGMT
jgi:hypothetical protein